MHVEDVHKPIDLDSAIEQAQTSLLRSPNSAISERTLTSTKANQKTEVNDKSVVSSAAPAPVKTKPQEALKRSRKVKNQVLEGSLVEIAAAGEKQKLSAYDALKQAGLIRPASEYLCKETS